MTRLTKTATALLAMTVMLSLANTTQAQTLDEVNLGDHVHGPQVDADDLENKVVVFEYWGDRCPPCIRSIPHLVELQEEYADQDVVFIANQVWRATDAAVLRAWQNAGGNDGVSVVNGGALQGAQVRGVPHVFVFGADGELIWNGNPLNTRQFDAAVEEGVEDLPAESAEDAEAEETTQAQTEAEAEEAETEAE